MFETLVVGSYTRPSWLAQAIKERQAGRITDQELDELKAQAKLLTIKEMEVAGVDVLSDGEQGRTGFFEYLTEQLSGFTTARSRPFSDGRSYVALRQPVGRVALKGELIAAKEAEFLRQQTSRRTKVALVSPHFLSMYWQPGGYYGSRKSFLDDMISVSREEANRLSGMCDWVQWDDPGLSFYTEPEMPELEAKEGARGAVAVINEVIQHSHLATGVTKALHMCWGNYRATHISDGPLARIYPELLDLKVDALLIELASARHEEDVEALKEYPSNKIIAAGVIDVKTPDVEPVRIVTKRAQRVLRYVEPEKLMLTTDCGFAPSWDSDRIPRNSCFLKLHSMCLAAGELRKAYS